MARVLSPGIAVLALAALLAAAVSAPAQVLCRGEADDVAALSRFYRAVDAYVELRARHDDPMSPERLCSDPEAVAAATDRLAAAIAAERQGAWPGEVFSPEVADLFRMRLSLLRIERPDVGLFAEDAPPYRPVPEPVVNTRLAWGAAVPIDATIAHVLPEVPWPLEYWLGGPAASLVLVDATTGLVVDVLEDAWPPECAS
jgi:hypothetical protein